ncbi:exosome complex component RRP40 [Carpediemonas membranifera]|uniref:Exosome complex component RRP40 n=1 Tax=Carpediemonas membranifera TaxID=201153 RepID=A0A8J6B056_9EUKA|nr:exosome complex component RRP40 [Carpediemonas membranifera]|eukprot:KAG9390137.1 exosome complex component RRP40 [Carpediemonas membranifera]
MVSNFDRLLPGDTFDPNHAVRVRLGRGFAFDPERKVVVTRNTGIVRLLTRKEQDMEVGTVSLLNRTRRYVPRVNDVVVGVITDRFANLFRVDIGAQSTATMSNLASNKATKLSPLTLAIGDVVYCRVVAADGDMDAEVTMKDPTTSGEGIFGQLKGGYLFYVSRDVTDVLLSRDEEAASLVSRLKECLPPHELALGYNGAVYAIGEAKTVLLARRLLTSMQGRMPALLVDPKLVGTPSTHWGSA